MLQILCKTPAAIFKIQIPADTKSKFNTFHSWKCGRTWAYAFQCQIFSCESMKDRGIRGLRLVLIWS